MGEKSIAGALSRFKGTSFQPKHIGPLSRLKISQVAAANKKQEKKLLILISGPEKQRSIFEDLVQDQSKSLPENIKPTIFRGIAGKSTDQGFNHLDSESVQEAISSADYIICRAGYSTIMDLYCLGKTAVLVPTPGQSEQEYLAHYLSQKGMFYSMSQKQLDLREAIQMMETGNIIRLNPYRGSDLLDKEVLRFVNSL